MIFNEVHLESISLDKLPYVEIDTNHRLYYMPTEPNGGFNFVSVYVMSHEVHKEIWGPESDIQIVVSGWAAFDGIRHLYFGSEETDNFGYFNYPEMEVLVMIMNELITLQKTYCDDFR